MADSSPSSGTSVALRTAYEAENRELCAGAGRTVCWILILVTPPFVLVDLSRFPEHADALLAVRLGLVAAIALALLVLYRPWAQSWSRTGVLAVSWLAGLSVLVQMGMTGGHESPYFAGVGLVMLSLALLMPWPPAWTWALCGGLIGLYAVYGAVVLPLGDGRMFANNLFSYVATALIAGFATLGRERLRWREFESRRHLEESEERLRVEAEISGALAQAGHAMIASLDAPSILDRLCQLTTKLLPCDVSHTIAWDQDREVWQVVAQHGHSEDGWRRLREVALQGEETEVLVGDLVHRDVLQLVTANLPGVVGEVARELGIGRSAWAPLRVGDRVMGVLAAVSRAPAREFTAQQERLLAGIAHLASMALANAKLHTELGRRAEAESQARAEAEAASRAKDEFLATLSHELRTPLNVILGLREMADDGDLPVADRGDALDGIASAGTQLLEMIEDVLETTQLRAGQVEVRREPIELPVLWRRVRERCRQLPNPNGVALEWRAGVADDVVVTDPARIGVVLRNLVGNGLKFTERGSVVASVELVGRELRLRVADTGPGIPSAAQQEIFEMFHQLDGSDTRRQGGLGLGLHIARRFALEMGGRIDLDSRPGRGSTFTVILPVEVRARDDVTTAPQDVASVASLS